MGAGRWLAVAAHAPSTPSNYPNQTTKDIAEQATNASAVVFDGSDVMPKEVGSGTFWTGMVDWIQGKSSEDTTADIEASWPAEEARNEHATDDDVDVGDAPEAGEPTPPDQPAPPGPGEPGRATRTRPTSARSLIGLVGTVAGRLGRWATLFLAFAYYPEWFARQQDPDRRARAGRRRRRRVRALLLHQHVRRGAAGAAVARR